MDKTLEFKPFKGGQEKIISDMVWKVFCEFDAPDYSDKGIRTFKRFIDPEKLLTEVKKNNMIIYCCFDRNELVGVIAFRNTNHVSLLFVKKTHQKRGIAKELLRIGVKRIKKENTELTLLSVNSSPYAVNIYSKLGFISTDKMQEKNGIIFMPMKKTVI